MSQRPDMVMDVATDRLCVLFKGEMGVQSNAESFDCIRGMVEPAMVG